MSKQSTHGIVWTDWTWNPIRGCSRVSEGCRNCYAERMAARFSGSGQPYEGLARTVNGHPAWTGQLRLVEAHLLDPLKWKTPRRIFVNSMSDLFHENLPEEDVAQVFAVMACSPRHTFQVLTKRADRMRALLASHEFWIGVGAFVEEIAFENTDPFHRRSDDLRAIAQLGAPDAPLPNVWLGVSIEDQAAANTRIPLLLHTPAAVRWVSAEPLLGPIDLTDIVVSDEGAIPEDHFNALSLEEWTPEEAAEEFGEENARTLDWVVVGGESGPAARPTHPDWARSLRDQCKAEGVRFFFKQWGEWAPNCLCATAIAHREVRRPEPGKPGCMFRCGKRGAGRELDGRTWDEFPASSITS